MKDEETENEFSHKSDSDGTKVSGEYRINLSDGRTQIVTYYATDEEGFVADVKYEGEARPYEPPARDEEDAEVEEVPAIEEEVKEDSVEEPNNGYHLSVPHNLYHPPRRTYSDHF